MKMNRILSLGGWSIAMGLGFYFIDTLGPLASESKDNSELILSSLLFGIAMGMFFDFIIANSNNRNRRQRSEP